MSNIELMQKDKNPTIQIFADTIVSLSKSQGFYSRLLRDINNMPEEDLNDLTSTLDNVTLKTPLDVILYLEQ